VIIAVLFVNSFIKATCTASNSKDMGEITPHILSLKTCALVIYPIYPQVASFCYGLMAADFPWLTQFYSSYLTYNADIEPAGFQLYYENMNFASLYLSALIVCLLLLFFGYLSISKASKKSQEVFSLA
jgi:hypothetical protein